MNVLVVSGFLGAGKTTFIKEMVRKTEKELVVMENEYGEAGIDGSLLQDERKLNVWELTEGCVCCTMKADFASSILTIANTLNPEYLIVEPTGIGYLSNVIANIRQITYEKIRLLAPVTIVDANTMESLRADYRDIFDDQLSSAHTILFSKGGFESPERTKALEKAIRAIAPDAHMLPFHYTQAERDWWDRLLSTDLSGHVLLPKTNPLSNLDSVSIGEASVPSDAHLLAFLEELIRGTYGSIIRAKGFVQAGSHLLRFDVVDGCYSITGMDESASGSASAAKTVFIGTEIRRNLLWRRLIPGYIRQVKIQSREPGSTPSLPKKTRYETVKNQPEP